jgi:hypothetical protein
MSRDILTKHLATALTARQTGKLHIATYSLDLGLAADAGTRIKGDCRVFFDAANFRPAKVDQKVNNLKVRKVESKRLFHSKVWFFHQKNGCRMHILFGSPNLSEREMHSQRNFVVFFRNIVRSRIPNLAKAMPVFALYNVTSDHFKFLRKVTDLESIILALLDHYSLRIRIAIASPEYVSAGLLKKIKGKRKLDHLLIFTRDSAPKLSKLAKKYYAYNPRNWCLHGKMLYVEDCDGDHAILYVGSANFTRAGYMGKKDNSNIESGVVLIAERSKDVKTLRDSVKCFLRGQYYEAAKTNKCDSEKNYRMCAHKFIRLFLSQLRFSNGNLTFPKKLFKIPIQKLKYSFGREEDKQYTIWSFTDRDAYVKYHPWQPYSKIDLTLANQNRKRKIEILNEYLKDIYLPPMSGECLDFNSISRKDDVFEIIDKSERGSRPTAKGQKRKAPHGNHGRVLSRQDARFPWHAFEEINRHVKDSDWMEEQLALLRKKIENDDDSLRNKKRFLVLQKVLEAMRAS